MKRVVIIAICLTGVLSFTSCGSTAPCGLSEQTKQNQTDYHQADILVVESIIE